MRVGDDAARAEWHDFHTSGKLCGLKHISLTCNDASCRTKDMGTAGPASTFGCEYCERNKTHKHVRAWDRGSMPASCLGLLRTYDRTMRQVNDLEEHMHSIYPQYDFTGQTHKHVINIDGVKASKVEAEIGAYVRDNNKGIRCAPLFELEFTNCLGDPMHWYALDRLIDLLDIRTYLFPICIAGL